MYALMIISKEQEVSVLGIKQSLKLSWFEGMVGAIPVFNTREEAEACRGERNIEIFTIEEVKEGL